MAYNKDEVLEYITENDVKFIKLFFTDVFGSTKSISIQPSQINVALEQGIAFDASSEKGFLNYYENDLYIVPDITTLSILPWRPQHGRVARFYCDIKTKTGETFIGDTRAWLKNADNAMKDIGISCDIATQCEFYLFRTEMDSQPIPHDKASLCDLAPLDKGENIRRAICITLEQMNIMPKLSRHKAGPGQHEVDFNEASLITAADNLLTFKNVVRTVASLNGLVASFLPKPIATKAGNALHINLLLKANNEETLDYCIAGILNHIKEMTSFLNPLPQSYDRLGKIDAPEYISWSTQNRNQLLRVTDKTQTTCTIKLRSSDPCCNPYTALTLIAQATIAGVKNKTNLPPPCNIDLAHASYAIQKEYDKLPRTLSESFALSCQSDFIKNIIPALALNTISTTAFLPIEEI